MISKPKRYFLALLFLFACKIVAQQQPFDYVASYKDNEIISRLLNVKFHPETGNFDNYARYENFQIVRKNGKYGIYNLSTKTYYKEPVYDSISGNANYLQQKK